ncbi:dTDP-4-dehydrorhamnose 3,5-epimerase, partial [Escherichia coli]|nr:dTDP-4-dehydrorhamnose 3,5-epimerase [Escherichia coli]
YNVKLSDKDKKNPTMKDVFLFM